MKGTKAYCILGVRDEGEQRRANGAKGSKAYSILGFRIPTTCVGARGEGQRGGKGE